MATLNLSINGPSISKSYQSVLDSSISESSAGSPTFAKWAIFSVSTPLVSAFQQTAGNKESVLKVQNTGEGELADLVEEFSEGKIQFAFVKVIDVNTQLPKNVLIAWCGEGVPERTKGYFTSHLSAVSKFLHGYHVQVTARSDRDLTPEGIIQRVGDASGAKYTPVAEKTAVSIPEPPVSSKPVFNPLRTGGLGASVASAETAPLPVRVKAGDDDGWGPDAPPVTRTNLEKVQPAYQPTKVNIQELRSGKQPESSMSFSSTAQQRDDIVKGGYQPIGKVDIAAIRRQAREAGDLKDDRPEPVRGAYEPVGKVDIAAIRAKAQKADDIPLSAKSSPGPLDESPDVFKDHGASQSGRITSLPKPKVSNRFGGSSTFTGTKAPLPTDSASKTIPVPHVGSASRTFADEGGKTPAQLWAERKAKEGGQAPAGVTSPINPTAPTVQNQHSGGGEWKSSYTGKTWAPVQTTHTGKSVESGSNDAVTDAQAPEPIAPQQSVSAIRDQLMMQGPKDVPSAVNIAGSMHSPYISTEPAEPETSREPEVPRMPSPQAQPPRSPTPPTPSVRESSPIRVAMPVGRGVADSHNEQTSEPATTHIETIQQGLPDGKGDDADRDGGLVSAEPTDTGSARPSGTRALVQYDYEKAEDNEIELKEGEEVTEIEMVDKDWWLGLNSRGERGLFPSNYVELIEGDQRGHAASDTQLHAAAAAAEESVKEPTPTSDSSNKPTARALYDYEAAEDNELSFPEGAEITNIEFPDDDWWFGEFRGATGLFPANYVQLEN